MGRPRGAIATAQIAFRLPADLKAALERIAAEDDRTLSQWIIRTLRVAVEAHDAARAPAPKKKAAAR